MANLNLFKLSRFVKPFFGVQKGIIYNSPRTFIQSTPRLGYEGDGKTTVSFMDEELSKYLIVSSYNEHGFRLSNGAFAYGSIALFPNTIFQWKVNSLEEITEESITLFRLLEPKLDLLLLGIGDLKFFSSGSILNLRKILKSSGLNVEIMSTRDAISTYNFMLSDYRVVAGAFLPVKSSVAEKFLESSKSSTPTESIS